MAEYPDPGQSVSSCAVELGADIAGVGMLQVLEDGERLLPGILGVRELTGAMEGVPQAG
jgi:hypothetical protein